MRVFSSFFLCASKLIGFRESPWSCRWEVFAWLATCLLQLRLFFLAQFDFTTFLGLTVDLRHLLQQLLIRLLLRLFTVLTRSFPETFIVNYYVSYFRRSCFSLSHLHRLENPDSRRNCLGGSRLTSLTSPILTSDILTLVSIIRVEHHSNDFDHILVSSTAKRNVSQITGK